MDYINGLLFEYHQSVIKRYEREARVLPYSLAVRLS